MKWSLARVIERCIEAVLGASSLVTTLTVVLIVVFLFREGAGIFGGSPVEEGASLVVNRRNPVASLSAAEVKRIFDQEVTDWQQLGGKRDSIILFRIDNIDQYFTEEQLGDSLQNVGACISQLVDSLTGVIAFVPDKYCGPDMKGKKVEVQRISLGGFLSSKEWFPSAQPAAQFGALPLLLGTLWVSLGAILFALPLGLATAVYMAEIASGPKRRFLKPMVELLAGIPSVVYGFFGLVIIVPGIQRLFDLPVGETALAGSIILGIMALPTIITISEDAMRTTPRAMKDASLALGANQWQTIHRVVIPYAGSGIATAAILGIGRAIGETMAVLMVTGNAAVIPHSPLEPVRTIPATIAAELGEAPQGGLHYESLFVLGCILFLITLATNLVVERISKKRRINR